MDSPNNFVIQEYLNKIEEEVADRDFSRGYDGVIHKKIHIGIAGGRFATAEKLFIAALNRYWADKDKDGLIEAVDEYLRSAHS